MASAGSVFTASPETKATIDTPPQDTQGESKSYYPTLSPPRFRLSPSGTTGDTWGSSMTSRASSNVQEPDWERENSFYKHSEAPQGLRASGYYAGNPQQSMQKSAMEAMERGLLSLSLNTPLPTLSPLSPQSLAPSLPSQIPRRFAADSGNMVDSPRQLRPPVDPFSSQVLLSPSRPESTPSPAYPPDWSDTPTRHLMINAPASIDIDALKQLLKVNVHSIDRFRALLTGH